MTDLAHAPHPGDWYIRGFGEWYPLLYGHRDDEQARREVAGLTRLADLRPGHRALDVCCGAGRHIEPLIEAGIDAFGVDLSEALLQKAAERPALAGRLVRADVRALPFDRGFDAALNLFTSFGYFPTDAENGRQLHQMARTLRPGGRLLMDLVNPARLWRDLEPYSRQHLDDYVVEHRRRIIGNRVVKHTTVAEPEGPTHRFTESVRVYESAELKEMCAAAGLARPRLFGAFDGRPFEANAPRMILLATAN